MEYGTEAPDYGAVGQNAQRRGPVAVAALSAFAVGAAGVSAALLSGGPDYTHAVTVLRQATQVTVVAPNGRLVPGRVGMRLAPRDEVVTARRGFADLATAGRSVYLAGGSAVQVVDGEDDQLRTGSLVADLRRGPPLSVGVSGFTVAAGAGAVVRVDHGFALRVGELAGSVQVSSQDGRVLDVPALSQLQTLGEALPAAATGPLRLTDDRAELATGLPVVLDDVLLNGWAAGAGADRAAAASLTAVVRDTATPVSGCPLPGAGGPQRLLPVAIARAAGGRLPYRVRYGRAVCDRFQGGSWGVIAHLLGTDALRTLAQLNALLTPVTPVALAGASGASAASGGVVGAVADGGRGGGSGGGAGSVATGAGGGAAPAPSGTSSPAPSPAPSPVPTSPGLPAPLPSLPLPSSPVPSPSPSGLVSTVVGTVAGLLGSTPPSPVPSPSASGSSGGGLLSGLLGG